MSSSALPPELAELKHCLNVAVSFKDSDICICYWSRLCALEKALNEPKNKQIESVRQYLLSVMDWLEEIKKNSTNEKITSKRAGMEHMENFTVELYNAAVKRDKQCIYDKATIGLYYKAWALFEVIHHFNGTDFLFTKEAQHSKLRSAYLNKCLNSGDTPEPLVDNDNGNDDEDDSNNADLNFQSTSTTNQHTDDNVVLPSNEADAVSNDTNSTADESSQSTVAVTDPAISQKAQKLCRFAISALNYDDFDTAIKNLRSALDSLEAIKRQ